MSRILVTGGAGFIGSHLCEFLLNNGDKVVAVDNFYTGTKKNIAHLIHNPNFELIMHDMINPLYVEVDQIYNLACPASPIHYPEKPYSNSENGNGGHGQLLGLARRTNAKILQASTSRFMAIL